MTDACRQRCQRSTDRSRLQKPIQARGVPRSGCHGQGKGRLSFLSCCDIVGLLRLQTARTGGLSARVS